MNPGDKTAEQKFKEATDAYNILSDQKKIMINMVMLPLTEPEQNLKFYKLPKLWWCSWRISGIPL